MAGLCSGYASLLDVKHTYMFLFDNNKAYASYGTRVKLQRQCKLLCQGAHYFDLLVQ